MYAYQAGIFKIYGIVTFTCSTKAAAAGNIISPGIGNDRFRSHPSSAHKAFCGKLQAAAVIQYAVYAVFGNRIE